MRGNRESAIMVSVIDFEPLKAQAKARWEQDNAGKKAHDVTCQKVGFIKTPKGTFVLDEEGIINIKPLEKKGDYEVEVRIWEDLGEGKHTFPMLPQYTITLKADNIDQFPVKGQENLATFIRTFGSRLDANFAMAQEHLVKQGAK